MGLGLTTIKATLFEQFLHVQQESQGAATLPILTVNWKVS
jgi:hypothetical protein